MAALTPVDLLDHAIAQALPAIAAVRPADLATPTPCAEWDLRALLNHLAGRAVLSERAARGVAVTEMPDAAGDLLGTEAAASLPVLLGASASAWREAGLDRQCVTPLGPMPAAALVTFQAQDVFVHGWDIARALGLDAAFDVALTEAMLALHRQTISDELRAAFFAPVEPVPDDAPALDRLVGFLGAQAVTRPPGAEDLFWGLAEPFLARPGVTRSTMMGLPCLRLDGAFFAACDRRTGDLLVKLPEARVGDLVEAGTAHAFAPAGRRFRQWAAIPPERLPDWAPLLDEATRHAAPDLT